MDNLQERVRGGAEGRERERERERERDVETLTIKVSPLLNRVAPRS